MTRLAPLKRRLRQAHRDWVFRRAWRHYARRPSDALAPGSDLLHDLVYGWGNESWSGAYEFLHACIAQALRTRAPILECGSGLSTLLVGRVAQDTGATLWALEHEPAWRTRVDDALVRAGVRGATVCDSPLTRYGEFDWYTVPPSLPARFALVLCDGPPAATRGGRYGLLPVLGDRLTADAVVLLDDAQREDEQEIARRWRDLFGHEPQLLGTDKPYFRFGPPVAAASATSDSARAAACYGTPAPTLR